MLNNLNRLLNSFICAHSTTFAHSILMNANTIKLGLLVLLCAGLALLNLFFAGSETLSFNQTNNTPFIFWQIRWPKMWSAILAGASLSISGLILQILFRNPLAGPYVLGISSGASFMVALTLLGSSALGWQFQAGLGTSSIVAAAVIGSFTVTLLISALSLKVKNNTLLLLIGLMFGQIIGAAQGFLEYFGSSDSLKQLVIWSMGSVRNVTSSDLPIYAPLVVIGIGLCLRYVKPLQLLTLGNQYAQNLGVPIKNNRFLWISLSSVLTGVTTAFCGPIAFVGIAIPIASRLVFKTASQLFHLLSCALLGSSMLLLSDLICFLSTPYLPLNMVTTLLGCPLVIYLMFKQKTW